MNWGRWSEGGRGKEGGGRCHGATEFPQATRASPKVTGCGSDRSPVMVGEVMATRGGGGTHHRHTGDIFQNGTFETYKSPQET